MRRALVLSVLILLVSGISLLHTAVPVAAQEDEDGFCSFVGEITFDNVLTDYPWENGEPYVTQSGVQAPGVGRSSTNGMQGENDVGGTHNYSHVSFAIPSDQIEFDYLHWWVRAEGNHNFDEIYLLYMDDAGTDLGTSTPNLVTVQGAPTETYQQYGYNDFTVPEGTTYVMVVVGIFWSGGEDPQDQQGYVDDIEFSGTYLCDGLTRPLAMEDESPIFGTFNYEGAFEIAQEVTGVAEPYYPMHAGFSPYAVTAVARRPGMAVHAAAAGTIERVTPLEYLDCGDGVARPDETWFTNDGLGDCSISFFQSEELGPFIPGTVPIADAYRVEINTGDLTFVYVVANAPAYISEGDTVNAGCIIGETLGIDQSSFITYVGVNLWIISLSTEAVISPEDILAGFTVLTAYETDLETPNENLINELVVYPSNDHPCGEDPATTECMGSMGAPSNPRFLNDGHGWLVKGNTGAQFQIGGGVIINPGSEVYAGFLLDDGIEYDVTVGGIDIFTSLGTTLQVRIGTTKAFFSLAPGNPADGRVVLDDATPAGAFAEDAYEVGIKVTGSDPVLIEYACVTPAGGTPEPPKSQCGFFNHSFDFASASWTAGASIQFPGDGTALMVDDADGTLEQSFNLEAGDYRLSARVRAYYSTEVSIPSAPDGNVDLHYDMGDGEATLGSLVFTTFDPGWQVLTTTFTLASPDAGTFEFYLDVNSGSEELLGLTIDRFCLERDGGYTPPGGGIPPVINPTCEVVANPNDTSIGAWIAWLWAKLDQFFQCDLMILLNNLYVQVVNGINTMLRAVRYFLIATQRGTDWFGGQFIPWLGGYMNNIALGRTTTIITTSEECHDIFCTITNVIGSIADLLNTLFNGTFEIVNQIVAFLFDVIRLLLSFVIQIVSKLFGLGQDAITVGNELVGAWNESALPIQMQNDPPPYYVDERLNPAPTVEEQEDQLDQIDAFVLDFACAVDVRQKPICITLWILENTLFGNGRQSAIWLLAAIFLIEYVFWLVEAIPALLKRIRNSL